jgi:hypothetical protein
MHQNAENPIATSNACTHLLTMRHVADRRITTPKKQDRIAIRLHARPDGAPHSRSMHQYAENPIATPNTAKN